MAYRKIEQYDQETTEQIASHIKAILGLLGEDVEREGLLKPGDRVKIVEGMLPSNYYYTIHPSLAMSGNYPFNQRLLSREGRVEAVEENERGFYVKVVFDE